MNLKNIKDKLKNIKPKPIDFDVSFAVLVPIIEIDGELNLIFEVRSNSITQPGEISFPGGRIEEGESPRKAAIRETSEELLLNKENIEIISELNYASSKSGAFVFNTSSSFMQYFPAVFMACPCGSGFPLQVLATRSSWLRAFHFNPSRNSP